MRSAATTTKSNGLDGKRDGFLEEPISLSQDEAMLKLSPLGNIPYIKSGDGYLSESQAILEYLEDAIPANPLYPGKAFERANAGNPFDIWS